VQAQNGGLDVAALVAVIERQAQDREAVAP